MGSREYYPHCRSDRDHREHPQTQSVDNERGKLPIVTFLSHLLVGSDFTRQHFEFPEYTPQLIRGGAARRKLRYNHAAIFHGAAIAVRRLHAAELVINVKDVGKKTARGVIRSLAFGRLRFGRASSDAFLAVTRSAHAQQPRHPLTYELLYLKHRKLWFILSTLQTRWTSRRDMNEGARLEELHLGFGS